jgi:hypothetical protein
MSIVISEFENIYKYSILVPLSLLAILRQYDYLVIHKHLNYQDNI